MHRLVGVFIHWDANDDQKIYDYNYQATKESIQRALASKPTVNDVIVPRRRPSTRSARRSIGRCLTHRRHA